MDTFFASRGCLRMLTWASTVLTKTTVIRGDNDGDNESSRLKDFEWECDFEWLVRYHKLWRQEKYSQEPFFSVYLVQVIVAIVK